MVSSFLIRSPPISSPVTRFILRGKLLSFFYSTLKCPLNLLYHTNRAKLTLTPSLNVLFHRPQDAAEITTAIIEHPFVKKINYTGSTLVGSIIAATAGKALKPVLMELGGKAPAIVLQDADLPKAARGCALGAFIHSGQVCMSTERIIVHESIAEDFSTALKKAMSEMFSTSAPAPILVAPGGIEKNKKLVSQAVSQGAKIVTGDLDAKEHSDTRMRPIVVEGVKKDMDLYYTESFGPTVSLLVVKSEEEAIEIANDTEYGLSSAVFTENLAAGLRVARQIETGYVTRFISHSLQFPSLLTTYTTHVYNPSYPHHQS